MFCIVLWLSNVPVWGFPGRLVVKTAPAVQGRGFDPWVWKIPLRRAWQPTSVLLPGKSHRQRSLMGWSPWGGKESDMTEWLDNNSICFKVYILTGTELVTPCLPGAGVRTSTHGKGHEEGGLTYAKAGSSLRSPPGNFRASTPKNQSLPTLLLCALTYTSDFTGGCPPPPLSEKELT